MQEYFSDIQFRNTNTYTIKKTGDFMHQARKIIHADHPLVRSYTGKSIGIAVLDTGIYPHEDFIFPSNRIAAFKDGSIWRMVVVVYGYTFTEEPTLRISAESKDLRFFAKEELPDIEIAVTHEDIVKELFLDI